MNEIYKFEGNASREKQFSPYIIEREGRKLAVTVLTDLDGTVNDEGLKENERINSIMPAKEAFKEYESRNIPVGIITARSFDEAVKYQTALETTGAIICEDGTVIGMPLHPINQETEVSMSSKYKLENYKERKVLRLSSVTSHDIKDFLLKIQDKSASGNKIISSCTSSPEELAKAARHASINDAILSQGRLASAYAVGLLPEQLELIEKIAPKKNIRTFSSNIDDITLFFGADSNKGHAIDVIRENPNILFPNNINAEGTFLIAIGNHNNDAPLLKNSDLAVVVAKPDGGYAISKNNMPEKAIIAKSPHGYGIKEVLPQVLDKIQ